jgi:hypothetical protein
MNRTFRVSAVSTLLLATACGGSPADPKTPEAESTERRAARSSGIETSAEVGALPTEATQFAMKESLKGISRCFMSGTQRIEFLGGEIAVNVTVGSEGAVSSVFAERSTLGDRATEKCMFDALKQASWPAPVGGPIGIAQNSFDFEMSGEVRPPVAWEPEHVAETLSREASKLNACKADPNASYHATVYVGTDGKAISAGLSAPSRDAERASDCLVEVLMGTSFPEPGSWPAKVSFSI